MTSRILVVDDVPDLLGFLSRAARGPDRYVESAGSLSEALEKIRSENFDLIITDWSINPSAHGDSDEWMQILQAAKQKDTRSQVIVVSSWSDSDQETKKMLRAIELGAFDYVDRNEPAGYMERLRRIIPKALESRVQAQASSFDP